MKQEKFLWWLSSLESMIGVGYPTNSRTPKAYWGQYLNSLLLICASRGENIFLLMHRIALITFLVVSFWTKSSYNPDSMFPASIIAISLVLIVNLLVQKAMTSFIVRHSIHINPHHFPSKVNVLFKIFISLRSSVPILRLSLSLFQGTFVVRWVLTFSASWWQPLGQRHIYDR